jgi:coenzyme F420-0:L-glutamate ligase/coenzyme F420-1:gamma-L-glutamate ligase
VTAGITVRPVDGIGEVAPGDDLAALLVEATRVDGLEHGDVVVLTSKVVSKAEGRVVAADKDDVLAGETDRVLARRGRTAIVRTHHGLVLAGAGIDASNTGAGTVLLLPEDPDGSARRLRERLLELTGRNVAVVVTDTAGRAWRNGQTDLAIGAAGLEVMHDYAGRVDDYGNELAVTAPAVADEIAAAGDLVKAKLARRPAAVLRGLGDLVLPEGEHGPGATTLVRDEHHDMFGLGAREAVLAALVADPAAGSDGRRGFGLPAPADEAAGLLGTVAGAAVRVEREDEVAALVVPLPDLEPRALGRWEARVSAAAFALGWTAQGHNAETALRFSSSTP